MNHRLFLFSIKDMVKFVGILTYILHKCILYIKEIKDKWLIIQRKKKYRNSLL